MKMTSLEGLHASMNQIQLDLQQFRVRTGVAEFDCLFSVRDKPFYLSMTARGERRFHYTFHIDESYTVKNAYLGEKYGDLRDVLYVDGHSGQPLKPSDWLATVNGAIPRHATAQNLSTGEIARLIYHLDLNPSEGLYFKTWRYHRHPISFSKRNYEKTLHLLGASAADHSRRFNASSVWSVNDVGRTERGERKR
ncbi:DUF6037 family protein [Neorhizobium sp. T786]|uniref:DUF6037 family protein n=1 Tax=Pseudorhizobium xiangyangii TaxID=2883104 RepID=UPI001CFFA8DB|nr:DUF6037 family protein [Neorhizobium xiangyangii]MCB5203947.1 DUF6037 family protein [Neorhizobium xiangyangii]